MKLVIISDTHTKHRQIEMPEEGDVLIHCGDITYRGIEDDYALKDFNEWLGELPYSKKLILAGNHELGFSKMNMELKRQIFSNGTYLEDEAITIDGIKFYLSVGQPWFCSWEFDFPQNPILYETYAKKHWSLIPDDTNVLVTHGPAYKVLDLVIHQGRNPEKNVGCKYLLERINQLKELKIHAAGHLHPSYGVQKLDNYTAINAAILDDDYKIANKPIVIEI